MTGNVVYAVFEKCKTKKNNVETRIVCMGLTREQAQEMRQLLSGGGSGNEYFIGAIKLG